MELCDGASITFKNIQIVVITTNLNRGANYVYTYHSCELY